MKNDVMRWGPFFLWRPYGYFIFGICKGDQYLVLLSFRIRENVQQELKQGER
jgi:hypothetical protein